MTNGIVIGLSALAGVWMGWYALPICLSILMLIRLLEQNRDLGVFVVCLAFALLGIFRSVEPPTHSQIPGLGATTGATGVIAEFPKASGNGHRALLEVTEICIEKQCVPTSATVLVYFPQQDPPLARGQTLRVGWRINTLQSLEPGYRGYVSSQGAEASARANSTELLEQGPALFQWISNGNQLVVDRIQAVLDDDIGALATGIVTGDDSAMATDTRENFRATGTSHITAVSGQNVSLIVGFLSLWFRPARPFTRALFNIVLIVTVWNFTLFVGMDSPALRAAVVATLTIIGSQIGRKPDPVTLLSLTLGAMALINPFSVHSVGFWLSAVASMALCLVLPSRLERGDTGALVRIALGPAVASIATMPIALSTFGAWSPVGILTNLMVAPITAIAFQATYLFAIVAIIAPGIGANLSLIPGIPLEFVLVIVNQMAPVATQIRVDAISPGLMALLWAPIILGIWLLSGESERWLRRIVRMFVRARGK